jgi:hypothetical protein
VALAISWTAALNAAWLDFEGLRNPLTFLTNCSDAAEISSGVTGEAGRRRTLMLRHIRLFYPAQSTRNAGSVSTCAALRAGRYPDSKAFQSTCADYQESKRVSRAQCADRRENRCGRSKCDESHIMERDPDVEAVTTESSVRTSPIGTFGLRLATTSRSSRATSMALSVVRTSRFIIAGNCRSSATDCG